MYYSIGSIIVLFSFLVMLIVNGDVVVNISHVSTIGLLIDAIPLTGTVSVISYYYLILLMYWRPFRVFMERESLGEWHVSCHLCQIML